MPSVRIYLVLVTYQGLEPDYDQSHDVRLVAAYDANDAWSQTWIAAGRPPQHRMNSRGVYPWPEDRTQRQIIIDAATASGFPMPDGSVNREF